MRAVEVDDRVELVGEPGVEVVALALGLGPVDHADRALEPRFAHVAARPASAVDNQKRPRPTSWNSAS